MESDLLLALCMAVGAALYSSVGHAGASAYLALMALFGIPPATMRPTALVLNIIVASFGSVRFIRAGLFRWRTLWPFLLGALPFALLGAGIGLLSGLTGTGGGIFLSPLLLFMAWSAPKPTSGVASLFILFNSTAGLLGNLASVQQLPANLPIFAGAVLAGALVGTTLGIRVQAPIILKALGVVLVVAGMKLLGLY